MARICLRGGAHNMLLITLNKVSTFSQQQLKVLGAEIKLIQGEGKNDTTEADPKETTKEKR